jgi:hypothetical protein
MMFDSMAKGRGGPTGIAGRVEICSHHKTYRGFGFARNRGPAGPNSVDLKATVLHIGD